MGKFLKISLIILGFLLLGLFLHFELFYKLPFANKLQDNAVLSINTRRGIATVYLDGVDKGETPLTIPNLPEGGHTVELEKVSENSEIYPKQNFYVELYPNTEAVIDVEIAPDSFKSGHILYYSPLAGRAGQEGAISIRGDLPNYNVKIGGMEIEKSELSSYKLEPKEYDIVVSAKGFEPLEFPAIVREGYDLNIRIYLLPIPMDF